MSFSLGLALRRGFLGAAAAVLAATGVIGLAHTSLGRPLLAWLPGMGSDVCPVVANADPAQIESFRIAQLKQRRGERAAAGVPALDFELGKTTRADVNAWTAARGASCKSERQDTVVRCLGVRPATETGRRAVPIDDLYLQLDGQGRLVAADAQSRSMTGAAALAHLDALEATLGRSVGPPTKRSGKRDAAYLDEHPFARIEVEYRYRDYLAKLSATSFRKGDVQVREQYQWLPL